MDSTFQQEMMKKFLMSQKPKKTLPRLKSSKKSWKNRREMNSSKSFAASANDQDAQSSAKESVVNPSIKNASKHTTKALIPNISLLS